MPSLVPHATGASRILDRQSGPDTAALTTFVLPSVRRRAKEFKFPSCSVKVPYLEYRRGRYRYFTLFYYDNGRRRRETRSTFNAAKSRAQQIAKSIQNGQIQMLGMKEADRACYQRSLELLPKNVPLEIAAATVAQSLQLLGPNSTPEQIVAAVRFHMEHQPRVTNCKPIPDVVEDFLRDKQKLIGSRWYRSLEGQLELFAEHFTGHLHEVRSAGINTWLRTLDVGLRSRHNYRASVDELVRWSKANGYLDKDWDEMDDVDDPDCKAVEFELLTPAQLRGLLDACTTKRGDHLVPFVALMAFAGIRHEEINGEKALLDWSNIDLEDKNIYVPKAAAKTGHARNVPISRNLAAWLKLYAKPRGPICPRLANTSNALWRAKRRAGLRAGKNQTRNVLRKSFISYRLALVKDIAAVAMEAGNSPQVIRQNYNRTPKEADARAWFAIFPAEGQLRLF